MPASHHRRPVPAPRRSDRRSRSPFAPLVALAALNVAIFALQLATAPFHRMLDGSLVEHGGLNGWAVDHGEWWRIVTGGFLHGSAAHLLGNLVALAILGGILTVAIGPVRMALVYLTGLIGSSFAVLAFAPETLTVGASGAIFGLAGGALLVGWMQRRIVLLLFAVVWIAYALSTTLFVPGISQAGHLGGLAAGALAGTLLIGDRGSLRSEAAATGVIAVVVVLLFAGALLI